MFKVSEVFFSPGSTTKKVVKEISSKFDGEKDCYDLLKEHNKIILQEFQEDELLIIGLPVFSGRIPQIVKVDLENLKGNNTLAIPVVVYGNRDYDDALLELKEILDKNGFKTITAGAFVAQHSIFPETAKNRPDSKDLEKINEFTTKTIEKIEDYTNNKENFKEITVPGNKPYREIQGVPLKPTSNKNCTECGTCATLCPTKAIDIENPKSTDGSKCITCTACIYACPEDAREFNKLMFVPASKLFAKKCSERKEPEFCY